MWPWEHLAVGYACYSLWRRVRGTRPPGDAEAWAVVFGSLLPDLVDKPLAWTFGVLSSGVSVAHSVLVAVPVALGAWLASRRVGAAPVGAAFAVGYLLHLPADLAYPLALGGRVVPEVLLWPFGPETAPARAGLLANVRFYLEVLFARLRTPRGAVYLAFEAALLAGALAGWWADGRPGLPFGDGSGPTDPGGSDGSDRH